MTAYPLDAVSAAGPLCTHGKDKPGCRGKGPLTPSNSPTNISFPLLLILIQAPSMTVAASWNNRYYDEY